MLGNNAIRTNGLSVSIDWIAFTTPVTKEVSEVFDFLGYASEDFQLLPKGANGYLKCYRLKNASVSIMSEGTEGMGIHVVISGSAIADVLEHYRKTISELTPFGGDAVHMSDFESSVMIEFLQDVKRIGWLTRLDLAVDDKGCHFFSVEDLRGFLVRGDVVSKFRTYRDVYEATLENETTGHTLYLGSRQSEVMLRVYDKQLEQNRKVECEEDKLQEPWVRWEIELKNERANIAADMLIGQKSLGNVVTGILQNYVRLIVQDDSNRSRCSMHPLWEKFVQLVDGLSLYVEKAKKTIREKRHWLVKAVLPTLAGVIIADGGTFDIITDHFYDAVLRMSPHMQQLVEEASPGWRNDYAAVYA